MEVAFSRVSFRDFDRFCEWAAQLGWSTRSDQLSYGPCEIDYDHFVLPGLTVARHRVMQSQRDVFEVPAGHVVFVIPRAKLPVIWSGKELPPSLLGLLLPGLEHSVTLPAGWDAYEFTAAEDLVREEEIFPPDFFGEAARIRRIRQPFLPLPEPETRRFVKKLDHVFDQARTAEGSLPESFDALDFYDVLICGLQDLFRTGLATDGAQSPKRLERTHLLSRATEFMAANLRRNLTASDIARSLGVSYRSLHYAFREGLGVGPYRYFLTQRLHAVRRQLRSSNMSVAETASRYGFYAPSRFARQYRRLFGELPSETARESSRRS